MTQTSKTLGALLLLQFLLFFWLVRKPEATAYDRNKALVEVDFYSVDEFHISSSENDVVKLKKVDGNWSLPSYFDFPVLGEKVDGLFSSLGQLKPSWPAGKTLLAAKQFLTTAEKFEKKFEFFKGGELLSTVYIGTSPGFKKVHFRVEGDERTYTATFASYEFPTKPQPWADGTLYQLKREDLKSLTLGGMTLEKKSGGTAFQLADLKSHEKMNVGESNLIVNAALYPHFQKVLGKGTLKTGPLVFTYSLETVSGESRQYSFYDALSSGEAKGQEEESFLTLKVSSLPYYFEVARSEVQDMMNLKRELLLETGDSRAQKKLPLKEEVSN